MDFKLEQEDARMLINTLGQLPTNTGVFPILVKLVEQYKAQQTEESSNG